MTPLIACMRSTISAHAVKTLQCDELWFKTGIKGKARFIPIHLTAEKLGISICAGLPGFHALTGCDSTSGLFRIGKTKAWKAFVNDANAQDGVGSLGTMFPPTRRTLRACERFVCSLYTSSSKAGTTADEVRYWLFCQKQQNSESLPPTSNSLYHPIERANYQAYVWKTSTTPLQQLPSHVDNGWIDAESGSLDPKLMSQDPAPKGLLELQVQQKCKMQVQQICMPKG